MPTISPKIEHRPSRRVELRQARLDSLCCMVQFCRACTRMEGRLRVLTPANGKARARVMFIAEAPGRLGADRTAVPLHGDVSGHNFERMLASVGWTRRDVFVTNCILCNPRGEDGNNAPPTDVEVLNCSHHLESQINVVEPAVIATLGAKALGALANIYPHDFRLG